MLSSREVIAVQDSSARPQHQRTPVGGGHERAGVKRSALAVSAGGQRRHGCRRTAAALGIVTPVDSRSGERPCWHASNRERPAGLVRTAQQQQQNREGVQILTCCPTPTMLSFLHALSGLIAGEQQALSSRADGQLIQPLVGSMLCRDNDAQCDPFGRM